MAKRNKEKKTNKVMVMMFSTTFSDHQNITQKTKDEQYKNPTKLMLKIQTCFNA